MRAVPASPAHPSPSALDGTPSRGPRESPMAMHTPPRGSRSRPAAQLRRVTYSDPTLQDPTCIGKRSLGPSPGSKPGCPCMLAVFVWTLLSSLSALSGS